MFIYPGRQADFYIQAAETTGDATFPFRIMDNGTARFEKGLTDSSVTAADLASDIAFYVSGTTDGNNNAVFVGNVVMSGGLDVKGELFFDDTIIAELSIPGIDLQTDTNAFTFNPHNLTLQKVTCFLDNAGTSTTVVNLSGTAGSVVDILWPRAVLVDLIQLIECRSR